MKMKEFGPPGGECAPLRSANEQSIDSQVVLHVALETTSRELNLSLAETHVFVCTLS